MRFTFEETEIINKLAENKDEKFVSKQDFIVKLLAIRLDDTGIIQSIIDKISRMSESQFNKLFSSLPISIFEKY